MRRSLVLSFMVVTALGCSGGGARPEPDRTGNTSATASNSPANAGGPQEAATLDDAVAGPQGDADYVSFEGGLKVFPGRKRAEMQAVLLGNQRRALEFLVVAPGGAVHESLFAAAAKGEHLKRALEMIGLTEAELKRGGRGYSDLPLGDKVSIRVRFIHSATKRRAEVPVEDWLLDAATEGRPEDGGWVFTGSFERYDPALNRSLIESDMKGNLVALWRDASCVVDNARKGGAMPDVYSPNPAAPGIPESQSQVVLIFEPYKEKG